MPEMATLLTQLREQRDRTIADADAMTNTASFDQARFDALMHQADEINDRISDLSAQEQRRQAADAAVHAVTGLGDAMIRDESVRLIRGTAPRVEVVREPRTYYGDQGPSFFGDLMRAGTGAPDFDSVQRLDRHRTEMIRDGVLEERDLTRTDAAGGTFVPPLWLVDEYARFLRAGRVAANLCRQMDLPAGTDSINFPTITTGTATAVQTADNAAVQETDAVTSSVSAPVITIAGQEDAAVQLVEQSALSGGFDRLMFSDLLADYNQKLDVQVLNGSGSAGQALGILGTSGIVSVTYTQASPTPATHYPVINQIASQVVRQRYLPIEAILMRPDRWYWLQAALDSSNRPWFLPPSQGPTNSLGVNAQPGGAEGLVGFIAGAPVYVDANVPNNVGGGTNEDRIIVARFSDALLMEGPLRTQINPYVLSGNLTVRFTLYRYAAFTAGRYPKGFGTASGTGNIVTTALSGY